MISNPVHILNGSSLKDQFPKQISGEIIVTNECLVDGEVKSDDLNDFYKKRASYLSQTYDSTEQFYFEKVVNEFAKLEKIPDDTELNLWFEEDLFCQVNLWFVIYLIKRKTKIRRFNLVLPNKANRFGFGGMDSQSLVDSFNKRSEVSGSDFKQFSQFWGLYQNKQNAVLIAKSKTLKSQYPFLLPAVNAHIDRTASNGQWGRPEQAIISIMEEFKTDDFAFIFKKFCEREAIYGFGDLQVKKLYDELISEKMSQSD